MRIGVVTTSYPRRIGDHAGSFVAAHVQALRDLDHHVDVIGAHTITSSLFTGAGAPDELERGRGYVRGAWFTAQLGAEIARRARDWDLIIAHWLVPALAALPARKPLLAIAHGGDVHTLRRLRLLEPALRLLRGAKLAFVSEELRALAGVRDALVQPMGIDVARFAALARQSQHPPVIGVVARLVPVKGVDVLLEAIPHLDTEAQVAIVGDGPERARLERRAAALGRRIVFLGPHRRDELLATASVIVIPSRVLPNGRSEGMPMIALEALAAGVPVVASAVGGLATFSAVTRVRPGDPRALATAIDRVLAAPPAATELRRAVAHLDWSTVARTLLAHVMCETRDTSSRRTA